ncbi:MAG: LemA family protein [Deltaproteobacteria bacterium]|nr:LemA family protein [Deltaproteobacteria bacterium]MBI2341969.1 LemA family protein [Deltaproteobacteria bacterium]
MKRILVIILIVVGVLGIVGAGLAKWGVGKYNNLISLGQEVDKSWGQVENVMQRRNDLIPNLVNIVQAYAIHEQEVFIKVAEARALWGKTLQGGTIADKMKADEVVRGALLNLMAVVEKYPDLKANQNFMALQDELAGTENRVAVERMRYNETVQGYNTFAKKFPTNFMIGFFSFPAERDYFKAVEGAEKAPQINITYPRAESPAPAAPAQ